MITKLILAAFLAAHPLGNLSVNHYDGLRLFPDRVEDTAIIDSAEIPTLQRRPAASPETLCDDLATAVRSSVDGQALTWRVAAADLTYRPGAAGLRTSRLTCHLVARLRVDRPLRLSFANPYQDTPVGWREITASGQGVRLSASSVPTRSASGELRAYPDDLLSSPLDVRSATITAEPGGTAAATASIARPQSDAITRYTGLLADRLNDLIGADHLTVPLGLLALLISLVLGATHALLPGHGKTVMAAYIAGRDGRLRDVFTVAGTVTLTHTAGVLLLGLALSVGASITGDAVLNWLGVASGLIIAGLGFGMLRTNVQNHGHDHGQGHGHGHGHGHGRRGVVALGVAGGLVPSPSALVVLLGAVALGRTAFGITTVVCYGLGMALTLFGAAYALLSLRDRVTPLHRLEQLRPFTAKATAALLLLVGIGLAMRSMGALS